MRGYLDFRFVYIGDRMQKIYFVVVGKIKESFYTEAVGEYVKRLSRFAKVEIKELPEGTNPEAEADGILRACKGYIIALAVEGAKVSSEQLAAKMKKLNDEGKDVTFVIGSSCGLSDRVKSAADYQLSFSDMTFPHTLFRLMLTAQLYRAFSILNNSNYHK